MKAKWLLVVLAMLLLVFVMTQKKSTQVENVPMSIDSLMTVAPDIVGDTVEFEGLCSHLCKHGGTKAFLVGADTSLVLRCQATPEIGGAFAPDCVGKKLLVKGIPASVRPKLQPWKLVRLLLIAHVALNMLAIPTKRLMARAILILLRPKWLTTGPKSRLAHRPKARIICRSIISMLSDI